ncbi:MFS transporter [Acidimicrobiaceae bacterium USS-CC1]|uniref:MFS transporter n=1 Tax=Acidiferrimicrobium australe TaxID=2664430 RepID=A0ABW9QWW8_9ACTN|nr:MFS transporter [Acidiferrimicrobium australe]
MTCTAGSHDHVLSVGPQALRSQLSPPIAYLTAAFTIGLALFASATPSPLYGIYGSLWRLSPGEITGIYATYALGVLVSLLLAGRVSDEVGRKPMLLVAVGGIIVSTALYMLADSAMWLAAARLLQGVATGLALSTASAALLDLHPRHDAAATGIANGVASASGSALGLFVSSLVVQCLPDRRILPYAIQGALLLVLAFLTRRLPEPSPRRPGPRVHLTPAWPNVPVSIRPPFTLAALAVLSSWMLNGLFLSLGPTLASSILATSSVLGSGIVVASLSGAAAVAMLLSGRSDPRLSASRGSLTLAAGAGLMTVAAACSSAPLFIVATIVSGAGFGVTFLGGLRSLSAAMPAAHRAGIMSAFYLVAYGAVSLPSIAAGLLVSVLGLRSTFEYFGGSVALLALAVSAAANVQGPSRAPGPA